MRIRKARPNDIDRVMDIFYSARAFMVDNGNPNQWIDGYPDREIILNDMQNGDFYVCEHDGMIIGCFSFILGKDRTYDKIYDGRWLNDDPYGTIHRIASDRSMKGTGEYCLRWALENCMNLRIDTHRDNKPMRNLLNKMGFTYCGIILTHNGTERDAFQKVLDYEVL